MHNRQFTDAETGWYFSQDTTNAFATYDPYQMQKLFKFVGLGHGEWLQKNLKISIENIRKPDNQFVEYGTFDVVLRNIGDTDSARIVVERFSNCNLNPSSPDFIGTKIGTEFYTFNATTRKLVRQGAFPNRSKYIRVQLDPSVESPQANQVFLPYGVFGPIKYRDFDGILGTTATRLNNASSIKRCMTSSLPGIDCGYTGSNTVMAAGGDNSVGSFFTNGVLTFTGQSNTNKHQRAGVPAGESSANYPVSGNYVIASVAASSSYRFQFPRVRLRADTNQGDLPIYTQASWGAWTGKSLTDDTFNDDVVDMSAPLADAFTTLNPANTDAYLEHMYMFTLDDIVPNSYDTPLFSYQAGSRIAGTSITALSGTAATLSASVAINSFTTLFYGGTDGWDITELDPLRNSGIAAAATSENSYVFNTVKQAIDSVKDPEFVEYNLITIPNLTNQQLTAHLLQTTENRADALAIIDLNGDFQPAAEGRSTPVGSVVLGDLNTTIANLKARGINNSYGCGYYPYVQVRDTLTGDLVYMPPSVVALGAMSYTDRVKAPWFAPAGFNRGGLSTGLAGLPVFNVTERLTSKERDRLYDANINPIASFPNEGIVIFGQKTLQVTRSALDRINVRRLLIFVKKGISRIAQDILFEPNVQETWDRFISRAEPFLADVKARFGVTDYKLILDKTTTTPDLIDQNIMYAKIFLKPARAIEFIAVDFVITNTGAAFED